MVRILLTFFIILPLGIFAQTKDKVEVLPQILSENPDEGCKRFEPGKIIFFFEPEYPPEAKTARIGGSVEITAKVEETGNTGEILKIEGSPVFQELAAKSAQKVKFSPTLCDGIPVKTSALITYNFIPQISIETYFFPANAKDFSDLKENSPYFEAISSLADNYKICFGYSDKGFYENAPLTRGDFAQFLRMTLDLLTRRAIEAKKNPDRIKLFRAFNPQNLTSVNAIRDLDKKQPFSRSVGVLFQTYNIALIDTELNFRGSDAISKNEVIDLWTNIFGKEAVPVNFPKTETGDRKIFTRGEFALFLHESMQVLSYKVLP